MLKKTHNFCTANRVVFGNESICEIGSIAKALGVTRMLAICDPGIKQAGILEKVTEILRKADLSVVEYAEGEPEPSLETVDNCVKFALTQGSIDGVVGIGGGSSIDLAKLVATILRYGGTAREYLGSNKVPGPILPLIAVPTTSGTGSDVSPTALFTDYENNVKAGASSDQLRPTVALIDPGLTLGLPGKLTAMTGMDALCHATESYMAGSYKYLEECGPVQYHGSSALTDSLAMAAIKLVAKSLRIAVHQGLNVEARTDMSYASLMAGMAFTNSGLGASHAIALPIGAVTHAAHGTLVGILLPHVMEFNMPVCYAKGAEIAEAFGEKVQNISVQDGGMLAVKAVKKLMEDINFPSQLRSIGLAEKDIPSIAESAMGVTRVLRNNPRKCNVQDLENILHRAF